MPNFGIWELLVLFILALLIIWPFVYFSTGGLQKDIKKIRKMWRAADPNDNHKDR